jgi:hypothetical protein
MWPRVPIFSVIACFIALQLSNRARASPGAQDGKVRNQTSVALTRGNSPLCSDFPFILVSFHSIACARPSKAARWQQVAPLAFDFGTLPDTRYSHCAATVDNKLVVTHGYFFNVKTNSAAWLDDTWSFDFVSHSWSKINFPSDRTHSSGNIHGIAWPTVNGMLNVYVIAHPFSFRQTTFPRQGIVPRAPSTRAI